MVVSIGPVIGTIVAKSPEKDPEIKTEFAVSDLLLRRLPESLRPGTIGQAKVLALGLKIDVAVYRFSDTEKASKAWTNLVSAFEIWQLPVVAVASAATDGFNYEGPVMALKEPTVEQVYFGEDREEWQYDNRGLLRNDVEALKVFARLTGFRVRYCLGSGFPHADEDGLLNVYSSLERLPGLALPSRQAYRTLFGLSLWAGEETRWVTTPTSWRGRVIAAEGLPIFQVLGNNIYQLPLHISDVSNAFNRGKIWEEMLSLLATDLAAPHDEAFPEPTKEEFEQFARDMAGKRSATARRMLETADIELKELQKNLAEKLRHRTIQAACLKALENETADVAERAAADYGRLRGMADVIAVHADAEHGLMVETAPIEIEHDGRRYGLGPFRIHLSADGRAEVWSETPKHPEGHHHPHIDRKHLTCYGNITLAVTKLTTGYRFAETIELIIRWLRSHNPETTLVPLEEFPSEPITETPAVSKGARREKKQPELLPAAQAARSESRASRDADRRRVGRKPRRVRARQDGRTGAGRLGR